jgi:long-subunit fatty acid transport protein
VVFYGNVGYLFNFKRDVNQTFQSQQAQGGQTTIGEVDPGDTIRTGFGMAFGLNQRTSLSLGYQHDFIRETETEINQQTQTSESLQVGSLTLGTNYQASDSTAINVNIQAGVTEEAPDVRLLVRVPIQLQVF